MEIGKNGVYKEIQIKYCSSCKEHFIKEKDRSKIDWYMNVIPVKATIIPTLEPVEFTDGEIILNERSSLRIKGYHTGLNENARWDILKIYCVPKLGPNRTMVMN